MLDKDPAAERFEILHTREFNPNSKEFISFREDVTRQELSACLIELCNLFYELQSEPDLMAGAVYLEEEAVGEQEEQAVQQVYQCKNCFTVYDKMYGDELNGIAAGTSFVAIANYNCPTCEAPKEDFMPVEMELSAMVKP